MDNPEGSLVLYREPVTTIESIAPAFGARVKKRVEYTFMVETGSIKG